MSRRGWSYARILNKNIFHFSQKVVTDNCQNIKCHCFTSNNMWVDRVNRDSKFLIHFCCLLQETFVLDVNGNVEKISSFTDYSFFNFQTPFLKKRISRFVLFLFSATILLDYSLRMVWSMLFPCGYSRPYCSLLINKLVLSHLFCWCQTFRNCAGIPKT